MRQLVKKILTALPSPIKSFLISLRESFYYLLAEYKEMKNYPKLPQRVGDNKVKNILVYHISGMFYAGTEKTLQLIANGLADEYNVYFMYSSKTNFSQRQKDLMSKKVTLIEFSYDNVEAKPPHFINGMHPHIRQVLEDKKIDLIVTSSSGHAHYPWNVIRDIPIILVNIFGSPSVQKNIIARVFISKEIQDYSERFTGPVASNLWAHLAVSTEREESEASKKEVRERLKIPEGSFVFGRIGRGEDSIFDPIGINAFKSVVKKYPHAQYLILSPPPILRKIVEEESIPNVYFMSDKEDIWDFYYSIDALAHFRFDGETFGLNIAEAMYAGNPIISHVSHIWNAHLEYLKDTFSRVAKKDDVKAYAAYMEEFLNLATNEKSRWLAMRDEAKRAARKNFSKEVYIQKIKAILQKHD